VEETKKTVVGADNEMGDDEEKIEKGGCFDNL